MNNAISVLCEFAANNLPDSLVERKKVLRALEKVLSAKDSIYSDVQAQLAGIAALEKLNLQLQMKFKSEAA